MRMLMAAVVVMGVMIVAGVATLGYLIATRTFASQAVAANLLLDEPAGTSIAEASLSGDRLALRLQGGGPDRVVLLDARSGKETGRIGLKR